METMNNDGFRPFRRRNRAGPGRFAPPSGRAIRPRRGAPRGAPERIPPGPGRAARTRAAFIATMNETGFGADIGGGLASRDPKRGLNAETRGRGAVAARHAGRPGGKPKRGRFGRPEGTAPGGALRLRLRGVRRRHQIHAGGRRRAHGLGPRVRLGLAPGAATRRSWAMPVTAATG